MVHETFREVDRFLESDKMALAVRVDGAVTQAAIDQKALRDFSRRIRPGRRTLEISTVPFSINTMVVEVDLEPTEYRVLDEPIDIYTTRIWIERVSDSSLLAPKAPLPTHLVKTIFGALASGGIGAPRYPDPGVRVSKEGGPPDVPHATISGHRKSATWTEGGFLTWISGIDGDPVRPGRWSTRANFYVSPGRHTVHVGSLHINGGVFTSFEIEAKEGAEYVAVSGDAEGEYKYAWDRPLEIWMEDAETGERATPVVRALGRYIQR